MTTFEYSAKDSSGKVTKGIVEAETESAAGSLLLARSLTPLHIKIKEQNRGLVARFTNRISRKDKVIFTRQLATLINAGLPLTQSLRTVAEQSSNKHLALVLGQVTTSVEGGNTLASSMEKHPKVFNEIYVALVAAGEASGTLDKALERIANQQEKDGEMLSKVRGALVYPVIVLVVIVGVVVFLLTTVVPQIKLIYNDFNKELPFTTSILLWFSNLITHFWYLIILGAILIVYLLSRYVKTTNGRSAFDELKLKVPLFGPLFRKLYMARFCRTGQTLMESGVPMLEMLRITGQAINNVHVEKAISNAANKVKGGKALSDSLKPEDSFLPLVPQMLNIGEKSGAIEKMMEKAAIYYENELDNQVKTITTTIEPVLMVVLAIVVGVIVLAILLPVYGLVGDNLSI